MTKTLSPLPPSQAPTYPLQEQLHACAKALIDAELPALVPALLPPAEYQALHHPNGKRTAWLDALATLPTLQASQRNFNSARVQLGQAADASPEQRALLENVLQQFIPWRKGPFELFGIHIDTEWRSDWKWQRIIPHISPLQGKTVLDIGCGSGYHLWRMQGQGARLVLGIDPSLFFLMQFHCIRHYSGQPPVHFLPLRSEDLPDLQGLGQGFDSVFSMGVLYHRRSPLQHLQELKAVLKPGGELILETLVIEQSQQNVLMPENRYAKMRNVWFIPTVSLLELWLKRLGFVQVRCVDITATTLAEQRATPWMQFESLADFLDPENRQCTIEGYPAPVRATIVASRPN